MQGRFGKVTIAVLCLAQSVWLTTPNPAVSQSATPTLRRLKPILDTSNTGSSTSGSTSSGSSYGSTSSGSSYGSTSSGSTSTYNAKQSAKSQQVDELMSQALQAHAGGDSASAESLFRKTISLDPKNIDAYYNLGVIAEERGDYKEAIKNYESGLHLDPTDQDLKTAYNNATQKLTQLMNAKQQAAALAQEQAKLNQQTEQLKLLGAQAASNYHAGKYDAAIKELQTIAALRPNDPDVQYALAQAYRQQKDYKDAADHINRAIAIVPSNPQYRQLLSSILAQSNGAGSTSSGLAQGMPPTAPPYNYNHGDNGDYYSENSSTGNSANNGLYSQSGQTQATKGGIVPFTPDATEPPPGTPSTAWAGEGNSNGGYYNSGSSYNGSKIRRMLTGALIGATAGGLVGSMFHPRYYGYGYGYGGSYMMSGALWGGMAGLIFGGMR